MRNCFRTHSNAGVGDREHHVASGLHAHMFACISVIKLHVAGFDDQFSAVRHRIARVYHQVHQNLLNLRGVSLDGANVRTQFRLHTYVFAH